MGVHVGGVEERDRGGAAGEEKGSYDNGPMLLGSQPKSRTGLMGFPLLFDPSLENWSRHPDSCLPPPPGCGGGLTCG